MQQHLIDIADAIDTARRDVKAIQPLTDTRPDLSLADSVAVQKHNVHRRIAEGDRLVGYKLGNIAKVMQEAFGVDQPDYGHLLAGDLHLENLPSASTASSPRTPRSSPRSCSRAASRARTSRSPTSSAPPSTSSPQWRSSTPGSPTGASGSPTPSPTTAPSAASSSAPPPGP